MRRLQFRLFGATIRIGTASKATVEVDEPAASAELAIPMERLPAGGPGFFDSTFDLLRGLEVREGSPGDRKVNVWLDDFAMESALALLRANVVVVAAEAAGSAPQADPPKDFSGYGIEGVSLL
jgi:hypothetical protein